MHETSMCRRTCSRCDILSESRRYHASRGSKRMHVRLSCEEDDEIRPGHMRGNMIFRFRSVFSRDMERRRIQDI
ncbi:hypothetical protein NY2A_b312L [Paramecium bursaria Chlorella virus NY2A]|uniref:Uncharacterized protein b312L n=1 Tax=Paramecium bursaria Chlorella virus NY2A TaxID=46021 RepID=A7IWI7_PBCVN|nr:hypothetical protein NY2A_b312L [Paramecium bursaria Chlorella virus NY2A]ABT14711.1 hypothetical protein NY2A_b312L [Paramecium bursaria Chlorella virus NY2A]